MVENFSKDNYEYIQGNIDAHNRNIDKDSEEDLITSAEKAKRLARITGAPRPISGKTTAMGVPMSGGQLEEYDEEEEYSRH
jgi:hypothetical protein